MRGLRKFVLNTRRPDAPAAVVCITRLAKLLKEHGYEAAVNDWDHYERYDAAVFMAFDAEIDKAKARNPGLVIGLADPKSDNVKDAERADFLLVSSVEQQDLFLRYNPNTFIYFMFPEVAPLPKAHVPKDRIILGYHGNKVHLNAMHPHITQAMEALGRKRPVELRAIYNVKELGAWRLGVPDPRYVETRHIQWSPETCHAELSGCDIGIVPNSMMAGKYDREKKSFGEMARIFLTDENDYLIRFKYSSNPGRIYVFAQLGIPTVCDFFPSGAQFAGNGERGLLAHSPHGWFHALDSLASSPELRQRLSDAMRAYCDGEASPQAVFKRLMAFLEERVVRGGGKAGTAVIEEDPQQRRAYRVELLREYLSHHAKKSAPARFLKKHILRKR